MFTIINKSTYKIVAMLESEELAKAMVAADPDYILGYVSTNRDLYSVVRFLYSEEYDGQ